MRLRRKRPSALEQLRLELDDQFRGMARWELRNHIDADAVLARAFATMRGSDLEKIREVVNDPRRSDATMIAQIRDILDEAW